VSDLEMSKQEDSKGEAQNLEPLPIPVVDVDTL
jgi:hypothetical protein